ncbi:MAG: hypothetical protein AABZ64_07335 [Nitrospinota bacterium]
MIKKTYVFDFNGPAACKNMSQHHAPRHFAAGGVVRRETLESPRRPRPGGDPFAYSRLDILCRERIAAGEATDTYDALSQIEIEGKHDALIASAFALRPKRELGRGLMLPPGQSIADVYESRFAGLRAQHPDLSDEEVHDMVGFSAPGGKELSEAYWRL